MVKHPLLLLSVGFTVGVGCVLGVSFSTLFVGAPTAETRTVDAASLALPANYTPTKFAGVVDLPDGVKSIGVAAPVALGKRSSTHTATVAEGTTGSTPVVAAPSAPTTTTTTPPVTGPVTTPTPPTATPGPVHITVPLPSLPIVAPLLPTVTVTVPQVGSVNVGGSTGTTPGSVLQQVLTGVGSLVSGH